VPDPLQEAYASRLNLLEELAKSLERETLDALLGLEHVDRVSFRVKTLDSFISKATDSANQPPYSSPLTEIEDQVAGRVIVFFLSDIELIRDRIQRTFRTVERSSRRPVRDEEFGYESEHLICMIPPQVKPKEWAEAIDLPSTFELQLRTVFMHAYAEPQHDLSYKASSELPTEVKRQLAWIAASAWGADQAYLRVVEMLSRSSKESPRKAP
jgi:putative GTP pyrophosphokinase